MKIEQNILDIIEQGKTEDNLYFLPEGQLERKVYLDVNKVLAFLGGEWNRKLKAHIFENNISDVLNDVLLTGDVISKKTEFQQFETPPIVVRRLIELADVRSGHTCLEPSAGRGNIAEALRELAGSIVICVELDLDNWDVLVDKDFVAYGHDFLKHNEHGGPKPKYDRIVMNPPFTRQQDIDHVLEALTYLKDDGILVSVMSAGVMFRKDVKTLAFWEKIKEYDYEVTALPKGAFKVSGTMVNTIILKVAM